MNLSRRNFMKIAGLSAAAVAGAALFTGCSGQLMLPVRFSATVIGKETQKALDTQQFSVVADLSEDAQKNAINAFVRSQLRQPMYEVDFIERKTDTLDGKETRLSVRYPEKQLTARHSFLQLWDARFFASLFVLTHCKRPVSPCKNSLAPRWASVI